MPKTKSTARESDSKSTSGPRVVQRVQTGLRIEKRLLKALKALAEYLDISLGDLVEGVVLHAFENKTPFNDEILAKIEQIRALYELDLRAADAHNLSETDESAARPKPKTQPRKSR